ncbi:MAG: FAD-binding oxidoreductase [Chloroflexi bacterium]|nr:FAD-binding oxidoreductase [Chloroflexota bacterium]
MHNRSNSHIFDYIVIGKGLMGAAAVRYLSQLTPNVAVVGPDEPAEWANYPGDWASPPGVFASPPGVFASPPGVFASHYDQGRITRRLSDDAVWSALAQRAIGQYAYLEKASGLSFYWPVGGLYVAPHGSDAAYLTAVAAIGQRFSLDFTLYATPAELKQADARLHFPTHCHGLLEPPPAGYINPRGLLRAQLTIAAQQGARVVAETVTAVTHHPHAVAITTDVGRVLWAHKVLIAAGAFANCYDLLPQKLDLRVKSETILLARLPEAEAARLRGLPTVLYQIESPHLDGIYLLPPIEYPDGRIYLKMGCNTAADRWLPDLEAMRDWMIGGDSDVMLEPMRAALQSMIPGLEAEAYHTHRCLVAYTAHGKPYVDQLTERVYVATGGNGTSAKCSDTLGWLAANLMQTGGWSLTFDRALFEARFA